MLHVADVTAANPSLVGLLPVYSKPHCVFKTTAAVRLVLHFRYQENQFPAGTTAKKIVANPREEIRNTRMPALLKQLLHARLGGGRCRIALCVRYSVSVSGELRLRCTEVLSASVFCAASKQSTCGLSQRSLLRPQRITCFLFRRARLNILTPTEWPADPRATAFTTLTVRLDRGAFKIARGRGPLARCSIRHPLYVACCIQIEPRRDRLGSPVVSEETCCIRS